MSLDKQNRQTLAMLAVRMKTTMREFATGIRNIHAPYGGSQFSLCDLFLSNIEKEIRSRGLNPESPEFGGSVEGIRRMI